MSNFLLFSWHFCNRRSFMCDNYLQHYFLKLHSVPHKFTFMNQFSLPRKCCDERCWPMDIFQENILRTCLWDILAYNFHSAKQCCFYHHAPVLLFSYQASCEFSYFNTQSVRMFISLTATEPHLGNTELKGIHTV